MHKTTIFLINNFKNKIKPKVNKAIIKIDYSQRYKMFDKKNKKNIIR